MAKTPLRISFCILKHRDKFIAMRNSRALLFALSLALTVFSFGCATPALWGIKQRSPAPQPRLVIQFSPEKYDFLVTYAEQEGLSHKSAGTNSYWLFAYTDNRPKNHQPSFIQDTNRAGLLPVPVIEPMDSAPTNGYSVVSYSNQTFDLYHEGVDIGRFDLPTYSTDRKPANFTRVVLTPPAVIADTAIISCVVGVVAFAYGGYAFVR